VSDSIATTRHPKTGRLHIYDAFGSSTIFVLIGALPFLSGILVYVVLWWLVPREAGPPDVSDRPRSTAE
jgi:hypothetical protein